MTIEERLVRDCGLTEDFSMGLWLLKDGRLVNGTYEGNQRDIDHHEIGQYFKQSKFEDPGSSEIYIWKFERRGNIRWSYDSFGCYFEMATVPTMQQIEVLNKATQKAMNHAIQIGFGRRQTRHKTVYENHIDFIKYLNHYTNLGDYLWPF